LLGLPVLIAVVMITCEIKIKIEEKMKNRIKNFYKDTNEDDIKKQQDGSKETPKVAKGEWVTVHICYGGSIVDSEDEMSGIHVVRGKMALSDIIIQRIKEGIYGEAESMSVRIEEEGSSNG